MKVNWFCERNRGWLGEGGLQCREEDATSSAHFPTTHSNNHLRAQCHNPVSAQRKTGNLLFYISFCVLPPNCQLFLFPLGTPRSSGIDCQVAKWNEEVE